MIQPNELRLGNQILIDGKIFPVVELQTHGVVYVDEIKLIEPYSKVEPITLTGEILLKCGFMTSSDTNWEFELNVSALKMYCRWNTEWYFELGGIYLGAKPKYLHELQNLYYAILGSELTINP